MYHGLYNVIAYSKYINRKEYCIVYKLIVAAGHSSKQHNWVFFCFILGLPYQLGIYWALALPLKYRVHVVTPPDRSCVGKVR